MIIVYSNLYENEGNYHVYHIFSIFKKNRLKLQNYLNKNINRHWVSLSGASHLQKPYIKLGYKKGSLPQQKKFQKISFRFQYFQR